MSYDLCGADCPLCSAGCDKYEGHYSAENDQHHCINCGACWWNDEEDEEQ